jgi:hypothetical protein
MSRTEKKKAKKRDIKRKYKKTTKRAKAINMNGKPPRRSANKTMLDGVSIFELIMPWKSNLNAEPIT